MAIFPMYVSPSKIYANWDFWFENKPSANSDANPYIRALIQFLMQFWPHFPQKIGGRDIFTEHDRFLTWPLNS
jgi:hypothetical protein